MIITVAVDGSFQTKNNQFVSIPTLIMVILIVLAK